MQKYEYKFIFPAKLIVMMATLLITVCFTDVSSSFAASGKKNTSSGIRVSATEQTESRIKQLQSVLQINDEQKELWNNMTLVMRENAKEMDSLSKERAENNKNMNAVERMKFHSQITEIHLAQQNKLIPAFEALYTSMSEGQKKVTDNVFMTGKKGKKTIK